MITIAIDVVGTALEYPERVNELFLRRDTTVLLYSSRDESMRAETTKLLEEKGVKYDALVMGKLKADYYIDDKSANFDLETSKLV